MRVSTTLVVTAATVSAITNPMIAPIAAVAPAPAPAVVAHRDTIPVIAPAGAGVSRRDTTPVIAPDGAGVSRRDTIPMITPAAAVAHRDTIPVIAPAGAGVSRRDTIPVIAPAGAGVSRRDTTPVIAPDGAGVSRRDTIPMITPAAAVARRDIFDTFDSIISEVASGHDSLKSQVTSIIGDVTSKASSLFTDAKQSSTCLSLASAIVDSDPPTVTGNLASAIESARITASDNCVAAAIPSSLSSSFSAFESSQASWYASVSPLLASYTSACPAIDGMTLTALAPCSTALTHVTASSGSKASGTSTSATGSTNGTKTSAAASRERGLAIGALVGVVGAVALF